MTATPCTATTDEDHQTHTWQSTGLDIVDDELCSTRRCYRCGQQQHKRYGAGNRRGWSATS